MSARKSFDGYEKNGNEKETWTVGKVLRAMSGSECPPFIERLVSDVQDWMLSALGTDEGLASEEFGFGFSDRRGGDPDALFTRLEWLEKHADVLPGPNAPSGHEDVAVLCLGPYDFDEGMRMAVDYAALFGREHCRRVWMISDSWVVGEVMRYVQHFTALASNGVEVRFLLVTPWGWTEIPVAVETGNRKNLHWNPRAREDQDSLRQRHSDDSNSN